MSRSCAAICATALTLITSLAVLTVASRPAMAQRPTAALVGWIRDSAGTAVGQADVELENGGVRTRTDSAGRFALRQLDAGAITVRVRRLGYDPQTFEYVLRAGSEDSVSVTLLPRARTLDAVRSEAAANQRKREIEGFNRRRTQGSGAFITRADIERHNTEFLSETVREVPGIHFVNAGAGRHGIRFDLGSARSYDCQPLYWVDGRKVAGAELDDFPASEVEAVELYRGPAATPVQFAASAKNATCGTVVIWTRIPPG